MHQTEISLKLKKHKFKSSVFHKTSHLEIHDISTDFIGPRCRISMIKRTRKGLLEKIPERNATTRCEEKIEKNTKGNDTTKTISYKKVFKVLLLKYTINNNPEKCFITTSALFKESA